MRPHRILGVAVAAIALGIPAAAGAAPNGTVVWTREDFANNDFQLMLARADGTTGAVQLTHPPGNAENADWAPDGSRVYFDADWIPFVSIWSLRPDGSDPQQQPSITPFDGIPAISRDGTLVAHEGGNFDGSLEGIYIRPLGSAAATRLTTDPAEYYDSNADIAPGNGSVVFQRIYREDVGRVEIWTINADGTGARRLLSSGRRWGYPHFSPDGSKILVQSYWGGKLTRGRNTNLYVMNADGTNLRALTAMPIDSFAFGGNWSPDGRHIVYMRYLRGDDHIQVRSMDAAGNDESLIADCDQEAFCANPSWGTYEGALPAAPNARIRSAHATVRRHLSRRAAAKRLYRRVVRELSR